MERLFLLRSLWVGVFVIVAGCTHGSIRAFDSVKVGMDKEGVLESVGSPHRTMRQSGKDNWIYEYSEELTSQQRVVVFENGRVVEVLAGRRESASALKRDLDNQEKNESTSKFEEQQRQEAKSAYEKYTEQKKGQDGKIRYAPVFKPIEY